MFGFGRAVLHTLISQSLIPQYNTPFLLCSLRHVWIWEVSWWNKSLFDGSWRDPTKQIQSRTRLIPVRREKERIKKNERVWEWVNENENENEREVRRSTLSLVPEPRAPPNGCCATMAPVGWKKNHIQSFESNQIKSIKKHKHERIREERGHETKKDYFIINIKISCSVLE
jgi:hypothetical protein